MLVKVWNLDSGKMIHSLQGHSNRVKAAVCYVPNDDTGFPLIISAGDDGAIRFWDLLSGQCVRNIDSAHGHFIVSLCLVVTPSAASGDEFLVSASSDKTIKLWNVKSGTNLGVIETDGDMATCVEHFWLNEPGEEAGSMMGIDNVETGCNSASTSSAPNPTDYNQRGLLCCGMASGRILVYDSASLNLVHTLTGHRGRITGLCLSSSSNLTVVFSVSQDGYLRSWSLREGLAGAIKSRVADSLQAREQALSQKIATPSHLITSTGNLISKNPSARRSQKQPQVLPVQRDHQFIPQTLELFGCCSFRSAEQPAVTDLLTFKTEDLCICCTDALLAVCEVTTVNTLARGNVSFVDSESLRSDNKIIEESERNGKPFVLHPSVAATARQTSGNVVALVVAPTAVPTADDGRHSGSQDYPNGLEPSLAVQPVGFKLPTLKQGPSLGISARNSRRHIMKAPSSLIASSSVSHTDVLAATTSSSFSDLVGAETLLAQNDVSATALSSVVGIRSAATVARSSVAGNGKPLSSSIRSKRGPLVRTASYDSNAELPAYCVLSRAEAGVVEEMAQAALLLQAALGPSSKLNNNSLAKAMRKLR